MNPPFFRACRHHKIPIEDKSKGWRGHEILWCPEGHRCRSWLVLDGDGETVAIGYMHQSPRIENEELARVRIPIAEEPAKRCKRGHNEWYEDGGTMKCRVCKRERQQAAYQRALAEAQIEALAERTKRLTRNAKMRKSNNRAMKGL